jgi:hypothetical protein
MTRCEAACPTSRSPDGKGLSGPRAREALNVTRGTRQPERAHWAARACLAATTVADPTEIDLTIASIAAGLTTPCG